MFDSSTVKTLLDQQLDGDHPLRTLRGEVHTFLEDVHEETDGPLSRRRVVLALLWRGLSSCETEEALFDALRFDLRCQWFVGFVLRAGRWRHGPFWEAVEACLEAPDVQTFFARTVKAIREQGIDQTRTQKIDMALLEGWANPSTLKPLDRTEPAGRSPRPGWRSFQGPRVPAPLPSTAYRPGYAPATTLAAMVGTSRALANARLMGPTASGGSSPKNQDQLVTHLVAGLLQ